MELRAKVGIKGQAVIPKPIRDELGIQPGDDVEFSLHDGHAHLQRAVPEDTGWGRLFSMFPRSRLPPEHDFDAEHEESYG